MSPNYYIETSPSHVTAWSTAQISFEPRDWLLEFRNQLRLAVAGLPSASGKVLHAAYRSPTVTNHDADVENALVYNIGPAYLAHSTKNGLVFQRFYQVSRNCPIPLPSPALHQYEYSLVDDESLSIEGQAIRPLASLSFELTSADLNSLAHVWHAAKMGHVTLAQRHHVAGPWGIFVTINSPSQSTIACSRIVKPLIDGITSALHCHDGSNIDYVSRQLGKNLGLSDGTQARSLLEDHSHAPFGATNLLYRHGNGLQWNPKDGNCTYGVMRCLYGLPAKGFRISSLVFDTSHHEAN